MHGFTQQLLADLNASSRSRLGVTNSSFSYRDLLLRNDSDPEAAAELRSRFVAFQRNSTERYISELRSHTDAVAAAAGRRLTYSCNNGGQWTTPYSLFDYGLGELSAQDATPEGLGKAAPCPFFLRPLAGVFPVAMRSLTKLLQRRSSSTRFRRARSRS